MVAIAPVPAKTARNVVFMNRKMRTRWRALRERKLSRCWRSTIPAFASAPLGRRWRSCPKSRSRRLSPRCPSGRRLQSITTAWRRPWWECGSKCSSTGRPSHPFFHTLFSYRQLLKFFHTAAACTIVLEL